MGVVELILSRASWDKLLTIQGVCLLPRPKGTKAVSQGIKLSEYWDGLHIPDLKEISTWSDLDRAAVCGVNGLLVLDFDSIDSYEKFWDKVPIEEITFTVKTSRGFQNWFFDRSFNASDYKSVIDARPLLDMEIFVSHHLAAVPGNTHPSGFIYEHLKTGKILRKDGSLLAALERLRSLGWTGNEFVAKETTKGNNISPNHVPTEIEIQRLVALWSQKWRAGIRNRFLLEVCGFLIREGWSEADTLKVFEGIILTTGDLHSRTSVIQKVHYQFRTKDKHPLAAPNILRELV
jgi:hypothetical protein